MNRTSQLALSAHKKLSGKIETKSKVLLQSAKDLNIFYTPGVGAVSTYIAKNKDKARDYTIKKNTVAVVSDGSAVLGLGNIGPEAALPVMEGKAMLFKQFANVDAFPIVLDTNDPKKIIETVKNIAPGFGGINLEDIAAPNCFEIEKKLIEQLDIPVMHDDQHGTAIVVLAGLINASKLTGKKLTASKIVIIGAGAAGTGITQLLLEYGTTNILVVDSKGVVGKKRKGLDSSKLWLAQKTNPQNISVDLAHALKDADIVIGVSTGGNGKISPEMIKSMGAKPIVFALANPQPEILPEEAKVGGAFIVATGRSDFPNQINNVLVFPGVFRGAFDHKVKTITPKMQIKAALNLANCVEKPSVEKILPTVFDPKVVKAVSLAIR